MDENIRLGFTDYFDDMFQQESKRAPLSNEYVERLAKKLFYRGVLTDAGYINVLCELGIYSV